MAESQKHLPSEDHGDDIVAAAFASYRSHASGNFEPPPVAAIMTDAVPPPRRRALTLSMAGLAFTGLMVVGVAVAQTITIPDSDDSGVIGAEASGDSSGVDRTDAGQDPDGSVTTVPVVPDPVEAELLSSNISLPDWPEDDLSKRCPAGDYIFESHDSPDGSVSNKPKTPVPTGGGESTIDDDSWILMPGETHAVTADLDGEPGDEVIVPVACGDVPGVIALYQDEGAFDTVEFVYAGTDRDEPIGVVAVSDTVVTLSFPSDEEGNAELRQFTFDGREFTETTDPGDEPSGTPSAPPSEEPETPSPSETDDTTPGSDEGSSESESGHTDGGAEQSRSLDEASVPG